MSLPMSLSSSSTDQQEQKSDNVTTLPIANVANRALLPIATQPLPGNCIEEEQNFFKQFENQVLNLVRDLNRQFPYQQTVIWSIRYSQDKEYCIQVIANEHLS